MGTNAKLSVTYVDNLLKEEKTRFYDIGLHPIHDAAKKDVGLSMAKSVVEKECGHKDFIIKDYSITESNN